ncbi:Prolyl oligopeptidase family protein [Austwickia chelonae]|uniref:prolyl oligopeptidase n=1 Tax=Austwickia chelonae NBRC 105200 TaxID=1184607 RepID=K6UL98_9MICO|nr:prolyl oligopeptidase family serine peptidase [Austwickia chelonae]GAB77061.1 hypothetical protein AUCHE_04_01020 [Austwickia chelonae NBRC 105200]SEW33705.1 Prolyl oligopeptidase family protein [Austwickia chelonae]
MPTRPPTRRTTPAPSTTPDPLPTACAEIITRWAATPAFGAPVGAGGRIVQCVRPPGADRFLLLYGRKPDLPCTAWRASLPDHALRLPDGQRPLRIALHHDGTGYVTLAGPGADHGRLARIRVGEPAVTVLDGPPIRPAQLALDPTTGTAVTLTARSALLHRPDGSHTELPLPDGTTGTGTRVTSGPSGVTLVNATGGRPTLWRLHPGSSTADAHWASRPLDLPPGTGRLLNCPAGYLLLGQEVTLLPETGGAPARRLRLPAGSIGADVRAITGSDTHWALAVDRPVTDTTGAVDTTGGTGNLDPATVLYVAERPGPDYSDPDPPARADRWQEIVRLAPGERLAEWALVDDRLWWSVGSPLSPCRARTALLDGSETVLGQQNSGDSLVLDMFRVVAGDGVAITVPRARPAPPTSGPPTPTSGPPTPTSGPPTPTSGPPTPTPGQHTAAAEQPTTSDTATTGSTAISPILLTCYGGFGVTHQLETAPTALAWAALGGTTAAAQVRGGGERGPAWHRAGSGTAKGRAVDDLVDVIDALGAGGAPIVLVGASHGGWLAASAALRRPGLAGLVLTAPLLDVVDLRDRHPYGRHWEAEFGVGEPGVDLVALSPVRVLEAAPDDVAPPPCLVFSPQADARVDPGDAVRWVRESARRGVEATLRATPAGHSGNGRVAADARLVEILTCAHRWVRDVRPRP